MHLIILAAGKGSRLPLKFRETPKCFVKINGKTILEHNQKFFKKFKKKIIVTGYKNNLLNKFCLANNITKVVNTEYKTTNMVESLFKTRGLIKSDVLVCYGDIIFNSSVYKLFDNNENILPVYTNWHKYWKKRMKVKEIYNDAEDLVLKKNYLKNIGMKISKKLPKYQYMGLFKLNRLSFKKMYKFYKKINDKKIDMTSFLNKCLENKIIKMRIKKYSSFWYEIDTMSDIKVANKNT